MNNGMYGFGLPPNQATRVAPPKYTNYKLINATTSTETVPANVYQLLVMVWGGGGSGRLTINYHLIGLRISLLKRRMSRATSRRSART